MRWVFCAVMILALGGVARADDEPKPEELKKLYAATLEQLKDAQNRKTQLAAEKADLEKQLAAANMQLAQLKQESNEFADKTYFMRTQINAWVRFIQSNPMIALQWTVYLRGAPPLVPGVLLQLDDPEWPVSSMGK